MAAELSWIPVFHVSGCHPRAAAEEAALLTLGLLGLGWIRCVRAETKNPARGRARVNGRLWLATGDHTCSRAHALSA